MYKKDTKELEKQLEKTHPDEISDYLREMRRKRSPMTDRS